MIAGMTDYTGVPMDDILSHLHGWKDYTSATIDTLVRLQSKTETHRDRLDWPDEILNYIKFFVDLFSRYLGDFDRLLAELPYNVVDAHIQIVQQIYESSSQEEQNCIAFKKEHIECSLKDENFRWLVDKIYAESRDMVIDYRDLSNLVPRLRTFVGTAVKNPINVDINGDRRFAEMAIAEAKKSNPEDDKPRPKVGAVVVKDGKVLATAHRGEAKGNHAEYIALEKRLSDVAVAGATVYTTLEPCTTRNHPKIPCVERIIGRKIKRVVIGMLDPDPRITGRGQRRLRSANIITDFFPNDLMAQVEDLNRDFTKDRESPNENAVSQPPSKPKESDLPGVRPLIVPKRYGPGILKNDMGYTGLAVVNDGEPAYDLGISSVSIEDGARLDFHHSHTERLTKNDGEAFYPCFIEAKLGGTFGSGLFDFMRERGIKALTVPITYRDFGNCWFQSDITLTRDVEKPGGLRLGWS